MSNIKNEGLDIRCIDNFDDLNKIRNFLNNKLLLSIPNEKKIKYQKMLSDLIRIKAFLYHKNVAKRQRKSYNQALANIKDDELFFDLDWKQKVNVQNKFSDYLCSIFIFTDVYFQLIIGLTPRQVSREYYNQQQRSLIGFGLYYREHEKVKCINIDLISSNLKQSGNSTVCSFR